MTEPIYGLTDRGRQRTNNEDAFVARSLGADRALLCVIDGVGGYEGGEVAAALAQRELETAAGKGLIQDETSLQAAFVRIHEAIRTAKQTQPGLAQMACVLTAVVTDPEKAVFHYAHLGDTRLYLYRDGSLVKVTSDHSFVGLLEDSSRITEQEAMNHPKRNEIDRALGFAGPVDGPNYISTGTSPFLPGDLLLLCSDGLSDMLTRSEMVAILTNNHSLSEQAAALVQAANERGGKDNITVVLGQHPKQRSAAKPVGTPRTSTVVLREEGKAAAKPEMVSVPKRGGAIWPWVLGLLVLLAALGWWMSQRNREPALPPPEVIVPAPGFAEQVALLQDSFRLADDSLYRVPDSLFIGQDSLQIFGGSGTILAPDWGRAVWQVAPTVRLLRLSHLELRQTDLRISSSNVAAIHFDSVRLVNVTAGVGTALVFRDTVLSGNLFVAPPKKGGRHE